MASEPRVLFDATAVPADRRGVGRYVDSLLPELDRAGTPLHIACRVEDVEHYAALCPGAQVLAAPRAIARRPVRMAWEQTGFPAMIAGQDVDVVHSPHYTRPLLTRKPSVVTLHDATFFSHPEVHERAKRLLFGAWSKASLRIADACIVPSAATRDELVKYAGAKPERVDVVHLGVDTEVFHVPDAESVRRVRDRLGIADRPYIAFLGTIEPRKNLSSLVRAMAMLAERRADLPVLVLAGGSGWDDTVDDAIAAAPGIDVRKPGFLPIEDLAAYLGGAELVAYPSLGEGFGLPVIEAMACGSPMLTTPLLSLPEVGGDVAAYAQPDASSLATAIAELLDDPDRRAEMARRGVQRAGQFSWEAAAAAHQRIYRQVAGKRT